MIDHRGVKVAILAVASYILYHLCIFLYVMIVMKSSTQRRFGEATSLIDTMRENYPVHFKALQASCKLPIPNLEARAYYERQRPLFEEAALDFELHPYWAANNATPDMAFTEVVHERIKAMLAQLHTEGRRDFELEKDRCTMYEFIQRHGLPHCALHRVWRLHSNVEAEIDAAVESASRFPLFLKACHLTQFSSKGTRSIKSAQAFSDERDDIAAYIREKWRFRSKDSGRVWQEEGDALTNVLEPGFLLQAPMAQGDDSEGESDWTVEGRSSVGLVEVRAEVLWGKVYLVHFDAVEYFTREGDVHSYGGFLGGIFHQPEHATARSLWIRDEGYLRCVFEVAEQFAHAAHIEYVRVDIFLQRGDPEACVINEISLSSGYPYFGHEPFLAKIWATPLKKKKHKLLNSTAPVYNL